MIRFLSLIVAVGFLAGCATAPTPTVPAPLPTQPSSASASTIEYRRSGGFAGFNDALTIDAQGHATVTRRTGKAEFDLTVDERNRLVTVFRDVGFASIPEDSTRKPLVPDEISYVIMYQNHTVKTSDTAMPDKLQPIIALLNELLDRK